MNVLIYGLGSATDFVVSRLRKEHNVLGYTDSYSHISVFNGKPFYMLKDITDKNWDYIIITIRTREMAWEIYQMLIGEYGIDAQKVIPYFVYANSEMFEIRMSENRERKIECLVFGNSHALFGILADYLPFSGVNLCCKGQDIYYNYIVWRRTIDKYSKILKKVQTIIIDLYDYNVFNVDISRGKNVLNFFSWGGCIDKHNFDLNDNYCEAFEEAVFREKYIIVNKEKIKKDMGILFGHRGLYEDTKNENHRWSCIKRDEGLEPVLEIMESKNIFVRHEDTIMENIHYLESFIKEVKSYNKNIKIVFTLIPRFQSMEVAMEPRMELWKREFFDIVDMFKKKYQVSFFNYKECEEIYSNHRFYYDVCHLNTQGGRCLTSMLARDLENLVN